MAGLHHQQEAPSFEGPDNLLNESELLNKHKKDLPPGIYDQINHYRPIETRPVNEEAHFLNIKAKNHQMLWFRAKEPLDDNLVLHRSILAYATDLSLLSTSLRPHEMNWFDQNIVTASIDHALWIHSPDVRVDQWLLYVMDCPWSGSSRGLNRGSIYTQSGELVASVAQEGLVRLI